MATPRTIVVQDFGEVWRVPRKGYITWCSAVALGEGIFPVADIPGAKFLARIDVHVKNMTPYDAEMHLRDLGALPPKP